MRIEKKELVYLVANLIYMTVWIEKLKLAFWRKSEFWWILIGENEFAI